MATISECRAVRIFLRSDFQCEIGLPYFFSMDGKYEAGPVTFIPLMSQEYRLHLVSAKKRQYLARSSFCVTSAVTLA